MYLAILVFGESVLNDVPEQEVEELEEKEEEVGGGGWRGWGKGWGEKNEVCFFIPGLFSECPRFLCMCGFRY